MKSGELSIKRLQIGCVYLDTSLVEKDCHRQATVDGENVSVCTLAYKVNRENSLKTVSAPSLPVQIYSSHMQLNPGFVPHRRPYGAIRPAVNLHFDQPTYAIGLIAAGALFNCAISQFDPDTRKCLRFIVIAIDALYDWQLALKSMAPTLAHAH